MIVFKPAVSRHKQIQMKEMHWQSTATRCTFFEKPTAFHQNTHTHCVLLQSRRSLSIQRRKNKTIYMQIKPYHLNLFMPLSPAKLHSYAQRHSITVAVAQLLTSQRFLFGEAGPCTFNR